MKSIFRYIIFLALSASAVLASCSKDTAVEGNPGTSEENQGLRTIILQFSPDTKAFVGIKSSFVNGDEITLSNTTESEVATVSVANGVASITTSLTGNLTAVYPSTAANVTGTGGPVGTPAYKVPAVQDGTMGDDSIIAVADITGPSAVFELAPALSVTTPSVVKQITIKSLAPVEDGVARTGTAAEINTEGTNKTVITVGTGSADLPNPFYVILRPGVKLTDLSFDAGEIVGMKGIPESTVTSRATALGKTFDELNVVALGNGYQINNTNWHPYVTIGEKKWATMNVGATDTDPYGTYFSWGSVEKVYTSLSGTTFTFPTTKPSDARYTGSWTAGNGFDTCNTPYYNGSVYSKYTLATGGKTVLDLVDDAAYVNWGGPWRMPTGGDAGDFKTLHTACGSASSLTSGGSTTTTAQGVYWCTNYDGVVAGLLFCDGTNRLFFPTAGRGDGLTLEYLDQYGYYWSSFLGTTNYTYAAGLYFYSTNIYSASDVTRNHGNPIRPVADMPNVSAPSAFDDMHIEPTY